MRDHFQTVIDTMRTTTRVAASKRGSPPSCLEKNPQLLSRERAVDLRNVKPATLLGVECNWWIDAVMAESQFVPKYYISIARLSIHENTNKFNGIRGRY